MTDLMEQCVGAPVQRLVCLYASSLLVAKSGIIYALVLFGVWVYHSSGRRALAKRCNHVEARLNAQVVPRSWLLHSALATRVSR